MFCQLPSEAPCRPGKVGFFYFAELKNLSIGSILHLRSIKELQYGKADKRTETESEAQGKKATGDPQSAIADGTLICCIGETLRAVIAGI